MSYEKITRSRVAIFEKDGVFGLVALVITATQNVVSRNDPRCEKHQITYKSFETPALADHWFDEYVIATVTENGWTIGYNGVRNYG